MHRSLRLGPSLLLALAAALTACTGVPYRLAQVEVDPARYEVLGEAEARTTGLMILDFIPARLTNKIQRAVDHAIQSKGGDQLVNIEVQESWFWAYVLNGYRVKVRGTVVKERDETARLTAPAGPPAPY